MWNIIVKEAGLEIIPTSSTSTQLAIGDALAVAILNKKKFNFIDGKERVRKFY